METEVTTIGWLDAMTAVIGSDATQRRIALVNMGLGAVATIAAYSYSAGVTEVGPLKLPNFQSA